MKKRAFTFSLALLLQLKKSYVMILIMDSAGGIHESASCN